MLIMHHMNVV